MNREIKKAAAADYAFTQDLNRNEELICVKSFCAGAEWAELKWIPVAERLPEDNGRYFCITADDTWIVGEYEHNYIFCDPSGCSWRCKLWCPIPDSLLIINP